MADHLGYRWERLSGQCIAERGHRRAIGLVVADVTNPFYGDIIKGAYEAAREAGHQLILSHTSESPEVERETIERELGQVDGIVIASSRMTDSALRMMAKQKPVVLLNRIIPEVTSWPAKSFTPSIFGFESRPFRDEPSPFLCAIYFSSNADSSAASAPLRALSERSCSSAASTCSRLQPPAASVSCAIVIDA